MFKNSLQSLPHIQIKKYQRYALCLLGSLLLISSMSKSYADTIKIPNKTPNKTPKIANSADEIRPLLVGQFISDIQLKDMQAKPFSLNASLKQKPALVVFYRGGWCPYCNVHLSKLAKVEAKLKKLGFQILAISPDKPEHLAETIEKNKISYTLLSDSQSAAAKAFGLAYYQDAKTKEKYKQYKLDMKQRSGNPEYVLPVPAAYLISAQGEVKFSFVSPDYKRRIDTDILLLAAKKMSEKE